MRWTFAKTTFKRYVAVVAVIIVVMISFLCAFSRRFNRMSNEYGVHAQILHLMTAYLTAFEVTIFFYVFPFIRLLWLEQKTTSSLLYAYTIQMLFGVCLSFSLYLLLLQYFYVVFNIFVVFVHHLFFWFFKFVSCVEGTIGKHIKNKSKKKMQ